MVTRGFRRPAPAPSGPGAAPPARDGAGPGEAAVARLGAAIGNRALTRQVLARDPQPSPADLAAKSDWKGLAARLNALSWADAGDAVNRLTVDQQAKAHAAAVAVKGGAASQAARLTTPILTALQAKRNTTAMMVREVPEAVALAAEADAAGVTFGGFSEEGPGKDRLGSWPYTDPDTKAVYVPKAQSDPGESMADFVFELNNAIRTPQVQAIHAEAKAGKLTASEYARRLIALEVEGVLRTGGIWAAHRKRNPKSKILETYDKAFFLEKYQSVASGRKTKADLVKETAAGRYSGGMKRGTTVQAYYEQQFDALYGAQKGGR
jgi:hypothetical protein